MQLFITEFDKTESKVFIKDQRVLYQLKKVLRAKIGYAFFVQEPINFTSKKNIADICRYKVCVVEIDDTGVSCKITEKTMHSLGSSISSMLISIPNKFEKLELITQKLSEIGIDEILVWKSERSVTPIISDSKILRLNKISLEAVEQSRGWNLPEIKFISDLDLAFADREVVVFDKELSDDNLLSIDRKVYLNYVNILEYKQNLGKKVLGIIGPEGGLSQGDYKKIRTSIDSEAHIYFLSLGQQNFRMETASIIGSWLIKNIIA